MTDLVERLRDEFVSYEDCVEAAAEIERLREIVKNDPDKWSFDALMFMAKRILDEIYPADIFVGENTGPGNEGVAMVVALRKVIAEIEAKG